MLGKDCVRPSLMVSPVAPALAVTSLAQDTAKPHPRPSVQSHTVARLGSGVESLAGGGSRTMSTVEEAEKLLSRMKVKRYLD